MPAQLHASAIPDPPTLPARTSVRITSGRASTACEH